MTRLLVVDDYCPGVEGDDDGHSCAVSVAVE
jgi:hypothetical protein